MASPAFTKVPLKLAFWLKLYFFVAVVLFTFLVQQRVAHGTSSPLKLMAGTGCRRRTRTAVVRFGHHGTGHRLLLTFPSACNYPLVGPDLLALRALRGPDPS